MRMLVLGGTGRIGSALLAACSQRGLSHLGTYHRFVETNFDPLELRDGDSVRESIADYRPETIAYTAPVGIPGALENVIAAAKSAGCKLVYFSGDGVFGECGSARREEDALKPVGEIARQQVLDERAIRERLPESHVIVRTSRVYGGASQFESARFIRKSLAKGRTWAADTVRFTMPTYAPDLADVTLELLKHGHTGTFHVVGPERRTDFSFARMIAHINDLDADLIEPLTEEGDTRPTQVWLDRFKIRSLFGANALRSVGVAMRAMREESLRLQPLRAAA